MTKSFFIHRDNGFFLTFLNGNTLSTVWGLGSYSDNNDILALAPLPKDEDKASMEAYLDTWTKERDSMTCEIMYKAPARTVTRIKKILGNTENPAGYLTITQWVAVVGILSNYPKAKAK